MNDEELAHEKIQYLTQFLSIDPCFNICFSFHGIRTCFKTSDTQFIDKLKSYIPQEWIITPTEIQFNIFHFGLDKWSSAKDFESESSSLVYKKDEFSIQRDFVAYTKEKTVYTCFEAEINDGFHNFFRWFLSPKILRFQKAMIHSSAILSHNKSDVYLFFGPSGAGKTTISELAHPRKILSDDMNILILKEDGLYCSPGGVGGLYKPQVAINQEFKVKKVFWLIQDDNFKICDISKKAQFIYLLATLANLPLGQVSQHLESEILETSQNLLSHTEIQELFFPKDNSIWKKLDPL